jgi:hypothetical protein
MEASRCPHILTVLADERAKDPILGKYTSVVTWNVHRSRATREPPPKRRKVSKGARVLPWRMGDQVSDILSFVRDLPAAALAALRVSALFLFGLLENRPRCVTPEGAGASFR